MPQCDINEIILGLERLGVESMWTPVRWRTRSCYPGVITIYPIAWNADVDMLAVQREAALNEKDIRDCVSGS